MTTGRTAAVRFALALLLLLLSILIWSHFQTTGIQVEEADKMATAIFTHFLEESGEPAQHFSERKRQIRKGGWEYHWSFAPCRDEGALRLFIDRRGSAKLLQIPECRRLGVDRGYLV